MSQKIKNDERDVNAPNRKVLLVDTSSQAVTLFYALGGNRFLEEETICVEEAMAFLKEVALATVDSIVRRASLDGYSQVRMALESPPDMPVWRYGIYPDYKYAETDPNRPRIASKLQPYLVDAAEAEDVPTLFSPSLEADDVIAIMVNMLQARLDTTEVHIWSQDRDLHQLLTHQNLKMVGKKGVITTKADAEAYWGIDVRAVPLVKALAGDKSDNIKGVPGIGPKKAVQMLKHTPYSKNSPYTLDLTKVPEAYKVNVKHLMPRLALDARLCTLVKVGDLLPGRTYWRRNGERKD